MRSSKFYGINIQAILVATTVTALSAVLLNWYNTKRKNRVPEKWKPMGKVTNLFLYPLKSGRRIELQSAECSVSGLKEIKKDGKYQMGDRTLVVYKHPDNECRTGRTNPKLVLIEVAIDGDHFVINAPGMESFYLSISKLLEENRKQKEIVTFYGMKFHVIDCGEEAAHWLSEYLTNDNSSDLRLGLHDGLFKRAIDSAVQPYLKVYPNLTPTSLGVYSDLTSFMLINQASVDDLLERLPNSKITINNFRPNIVVGDEDLPPYAEDGWKWVRIGDVIFRSAKPCTRCIMTTVDPESGTRNPNMEPLKTLRSYRLVKDAAQRKLEKDSPVMGVHLGLIEGGVINIGDIVSIGAE